MHLKKRDQLKEEWHANMYIIEAYLDLREKAMLVPYASILNYIHSCDPTIPAKGLTKLVKNATSSNGIKLFEMDSSTDRKLCKFVPDEELFADCPICCQPLNTDEIFTCEKDCKALYHKECIYSWMRNSLTCPNCRSFMPRTGLDANIEYLKANI
ncbi:hypothetical protein BC833DRAFT_579110 [Globomyces pollinis-pini]|nr:hypothetical protein BC833DRAFT_579110 [Globomyces pollinis-pini]